VYLAWLQWPSIDTQDPRIASFSLGLHHIGDETPDGFTFRVAVVVLRRQFARASHSRVDDAILTWARTQRLSVAWIGVDDERDGGAG
jgi:hypothetical protein